MKWYIHFVNPHYSHDHADFFFEGWHYVTVATKEYPIRLPCDGWCHKNLEAARDVARQLREKGHEVEEVKDGFKDAA